MSIESVKPLFKSIEGIKGIIEPAKSEEVKGSSFSELLKGAIKEVDVLQKEADGQIQGLVTGDGTISPHGAMIALEKADMAFQMMSAVRSKIIRAYEEVIRTQV